MAGSHLYGLIDSVYLSGLPYKLKIVSAFTFTPFVSQLSDTVDTFPPNSDPSLAACYEKKEPHDCHCDRFGFIPYATHGFQ